jgi:hypothetical protein
MTSAETVAGLIGIWAMITDGPTFPGVVTLVIGVPVVAWWLNGWFKHEKD